MPKLQPFDIVAWQKGLVFDFPAEIGGGVAFRIRKNKPTKKVFRVKPAIRVLADTTKNGRTIQEHYREVRKLTYEYGIIPSPTYSPPLWPAKRLNTENENEGLTLLTEAMQEQNSEPETDYFDDQQRKRGHNNKRNLRGTF